MHPLSRAEGDDDNSPVDPNYPGRYYTNPECREAETDQTKPEGAAKGYVMHMKYQLPADLECDRCIMQMVYCEWVCRLETLCLVASCVSSELLMYGYIQ